MKSLTEEQAEREGHPGLWRVEDVERALQEVNGTPGAPVAGLPPATSAANSPTGLVLKRGQDFRKEDNILSRFGED